MNPDDPMSAQIIVADYAKVLERDLERGSLPAPIDSLPFAKITIKEAIRTSALALISSGQMTADLREFLETAYVSLADYVEADLVKLLKDYTKAAEEFAADSTFAREKTKSEAWQTIAGSSHLAGEIARAMANEAAQLKSEFRELTA